MSKLKIYLRTLPWFLILTSYSADWQQWRGPLQSGVSSEQFKAFTGSISPTPLWTADTRSRGTPLVIGNKLISWAYTGNTTDLVQWLNCHNAQTGEILWKIPFHDYLSDTIYNRYAIGSPAYDPETQHIYLVTSEGTFVSTDLNGNIKFKISLMEQFGRMSVPNSRVGAPIIEGHLVIIHYLFSNWGADGPAADRAYAFDKRTGQLVWFSTPGVSPPIDSSFSTPVTQTLDGKRVLYYTTGCGHLVCVNAYNGKAYWKLPIAKNGVNPSVLLHQNNKIICIHGDENIDSSDKGRTLAITIPQTLTSPPPGTETPSLPSSVELWRHPAGATSSSPILVDDRLYLLTDSAELICLNALDGKEHYRQKLSNANLHSSMLYASGYLFAPMMEGKLCILKPQDTQAQLIQEIKLEGECLGSPAISNGILYIHTTEKLYAFLLCTTPVAPLEIPTTPAPPLGKATALQIIPVEIALTPGQQQTLTVNKVDENGFTVEKNISQLKWESFIPPTAKVKSTLNANIDINNVISIPNDSKPSAGAFKATSTDGLTATLRGRSLQNLPIHEDFSNFPLTEDQPQEQIKFAYPPLPWIGARFKFDIRNLNDNPVFAKTFDKLLFQRANIFIGSPEMKNYIMQADIMTDGSPRVKSDIGLIHQRYLITLRGNANKLELSSNLERLQHAVPFKITANTWYTLKTKVITHPDSSGLIQAKVWDRSQPEPEAWTLEHSLSYVHPQGSPGIFGFTPLNQKRVFLDNLIITHQ
jgi:outer membrane protein assembly factor BamB